MRATTPRRMLALVAVSLLVCPTMAWARRANPPPGKNGSVASGGATCMQCHGSASGSGSVQILGAPTNYESDAIYDLTVRVADPAQVGAGFQISVEDATGTHVGTLIVSDATNTQPNGGWVNHTSTGVNNSVTNWASLGNAAEYSLQWQAPSSDVGAVTFYAAGNAINDNGGSSGDLIYLTTETADAADPVPAVSEWGMVTLALLVLTAGTVLLYRRSARWGNA